MRGPAEVADGTTAVLVPAAGLVSETAGNGFEAAPLDEEAPPPSPHPVQTSTQHGTIHLKN